MIMMRTIPLKLLLITILILASAVGSLAQTTSFTYQGRLVTEGSPADGLFEFQFKLFDALTDGNQIGQATAPQTIQVTNGLFVAQLDFGPGAFNGQDRFLEISVGPAGGQRTLLSPRQPITSTPYSIKSLSADVADGLSVTCVSCVTSNQIASVNGSAVSGAIPVASVPAGSTNYIQNTTTQQAASDFNISGNGTAGGTLTANGVSVNAGGLILNDSLLRLRGANDPNHGMVWSPVVDGPEFRSFSGFRWQNGSIVLTERMRLDGSGNLTVGGKVGIGSNPNLFKLEVVESGINGLRVQTNTSSGLVASFGGLGDFFVDAPNIPGGRFAVRENGRVGIGTANPAEKLTVAGTIQSTSGGFRFPDGTLQTTATPSALAGTYTAFRTDFIDLPPSTSTSLTILTINVPPGGYLISATVEFINNANLFAEDNRRRVGCRLGDETWTFTMPEGGSITDFTRVMWTAHTVRTLTAPTNIELRCQALNGGPNGSFVKAEQRRLTATRLSSISVQ